MGILRHVPEVAVSELEESRAEVKHRLRLGSNKFSFRLTP